MTTKQEIIDYIRDYIELSSWDYGPCDDFNNIQECNILIKMIKDFKPKVKKFKWKYYSKDRDGNELYTVDSIGGYDIYPYEGKWLAYNPYKQRFDKVEDAQKHCWEDYEQQILNALED